MKKQSFELFITLNFLAFLGLLVIIFISRSLPKEEKPDKKNIYNYIIKFRRIIFNAQSNSNEKWEWLVEPEYYSMRFHPIDSIFTARNHGYTFAISMKGEFLFLKGRELFFPEYQELSLSLKKYDKEGLIRFKQNGEFGFINLKGEVVIPAQYKSLEPFSEGLALFSRDGEKYGYINPQGEVVIPAKYVEANSFSEGLALVATRETVVSYDHYPSKRNTYPRTKTLYRYIDKKGNVVIDASDYTDLGSFNFGIAIGKVRRRGKSGFYYDKRIYHNYKILMFNKKGKIIGSQYQLGYHEKKIYGDLIPVSSRGLYGYIDNEGKLLIDLQFHRAYYFSDGLAVVEIVPEEYKNFPKPWSYAKCGLINIKGEWVVKPIFEELNTFSEGYAVGRNNLNDWVVINEEGKTVYTIKKHNEENIKLDESHNYKFEDGYLKIIYSRKSNNLFLDKNFQAVFKEKFEDINSVTNKLIIVKKKGRYGIIKMK